MNNPKYQMSNLKLIDLTEEQEKIIKECINKIDDLASEVEWRSKMMILLSALIIISLIINIILIG